MIGAAVRRGMAAGLLAGVLAGVVGLVVGEPALDRAIALEQQAADHAAPLVSRPVQKVGLVLGTALAGLAVGALFGVAAAAAVGRLDGDAWARTLKLGGVLVLAVVVLPAVRYPPLPPGAGDGAATGARTVGYLGVIAVGLLLSLAARSTLRAAAQRGVPAPVRQVGVAVAFVAAAAAALAAVPVAGGGTAGLPADLVWSFRLGSLAVQATLIGGTAAAFGVVSAIADARRRGVPVTGPA